jgi:predicted protein tyrosine phosphatase
MRHILFVCSCNLNRSPTFVDRIKEKLDPKEFEVRGAGTQYGYPIIVNEESLAWADEVFVMDLSHEMFIWGHYPQYIEKVQVVGVSDQYDVGDDALIRIIDYWFERRWC